MTLSLGQVKITAASTPKSLNHTMFLMVKIILKMIEKVELVLCFCKCRNIFKTGKKLDFLCFSWGGLETPFAWIKTKTL